MANTLRFKRGLVAGIPTGVAGEPLFTTDTFDLYIGNGTTNTRFQKYIASGTTAQYLRGDGSLATFPTNIVTGTGISGQVAYWSGTNTQVGSNNLFWDATNSRLGIGTATPQAMLDVAQGIRVNSAGIVTSSFANGLNMGTWDAIGYNAAGNTIVIGGYRASQWSAIGLYTANTLRATLDSSGNLGLGVTPSAWGAAFKAMQIGSRTSLFTESDLAVVLSNNYVFTDNRRYLASGYASAYSQVFSEHRWSIAPSGTAGNVITFTQAMTLTANGRLLLGTTTEGTQRLQVAGDVKFDADAATNGFYWDNTNKRLGLGVTSPVFKLDISGDVNVGSTNGYYFGGTSTAIYRSSNDLKFYVNSGDRMTITSGGSVGIGTTSPSHKLTVTGDSPQVVIRSGASSTTNLQLNADGVNLYTTIQGFRDTVGALPLYLQPSGGNVGIGTLTDTGEKLQVTGTMKVTGASTFGTTVTFSGSTTYNGGAVIKSDNGTAAAPSISFDSDLNTGIYRISNDILGIATGGAEQFRITGTGATFSSSVTAGSSSIIGTPLTLTAQYANGITFINTNAGVDNRNFRIISDQSTYADFYIQKSTTQGGSTYTNLLAFDIAGAATFSSSVTATSYNATTQNVFSVGGTEGMRLTATNRNLHIGTYSSDSGEKLQVNGTAKITGAATFSSSVAALGNMYVGVASGAGRFVVEDSLSSTSQFTSTSLFTISNSDQTNNNWGTIAFTDGSTQGFAGAIQTKYTDHTNNYGELHFSTRGTSGLGTRLLIDTNGAATFSSTLTTGGNILLGASASTIGAMNFIKTGTSPVASRLTFGTDGTGYSFAIGKNQAGTVTDLLKIADSGLATFTDNARFSNLKGCIFVQTGGTLLGSISMDSSNSVTIDNNGFFGLSVGSNYTMTAGNLGIGHNGFGTSATRTLSVLSGTAPSTSPADSFQMYSNDVVAGNAAPHFRTENGAVIKLYQETTAVGNSTISVGGGSAVLDDTQFGGYTLRQVVKALQNQGILA